MAKIDVSQAADIRAVLGAPGTGKSHYTKAEIKREKRVAIWDLEGEYEEIPAVEPHELRAVMAKKIFKVRLIASLDKKKRAEEFDYFCKVVLATGDMLCVVEELRFVTEPSRAPAGWAGITLRGRKRGIKVIGTSQRPASIDKDFLGSATYIRCGALNYEADRKAVAVVMGANIEQITALEGHEAINWTRTPRKVWLTK